MKKLGILTLTLLVPALLAGAVVRGSIRPAALSNYMVAVLKPDVMLMAEERIGECEENADYILKVKCVSDAEFIFVQMYQEVEVVEVFKGDVQAGERICVMSEGSRVYASFNAINMGFVNAMTEGKEYLIFLQEGVTSEELDMTIYLSENAGITPFFAYESVPNVICPEEEVPYTRVKDNEVFAKNQEVLDRFEAMKSKLFEKYH